MFKIAVLPEERLLQSTVRGFFSVPEVLGYAETMERAHRRHFRFSPAYRLVIDASETKIQSQEVLKAFSAHIASFPPAERVGVVIGKSLNRFQMLRLLDRPHVRMVDAVAEAQDWAIGRPVKQGELRTFNDVPGRHSYDISAAS